MADDSLTAKLIEVAILEDNAKVTTTSDIVNAIIVKLSEKGYRSVQRSDHQFPLSVSQITDTTINPQLLALNTLRNSLSVRQIGEQGQVGFLIWKEANQSSCSFTLDISSETKTETKTRNKSPNPSPKVSPNQSPKVSDFIKKVGNKVSNTIDKITDNNVTIKVWTVTIIVHGTDVRINVNFRIKSLSEIDNFVGSVLSLLKENIPGL